MDRWCTFGGHRNRAKQIIKPQKTPPLARKYLKQALILAVLLVACFKVNADEHRHIIFLGDSLTEGYNIPASAAYPALVEKKLASAGYPAKVTNAGITGSTSANAVRRIDWLLRSKPTFIVLAIGANDGLRGLPVNQLRENLRETIKRIQNKNISLLLAGMHIPPNYGQEYTHEFSDSYPLIATEMGVPLLDFLLEGVAGVPAFNLADGIHPNVEGHKIIAENVFYALYPLLK